MFDDAPGTIEWRARRRHDLLGFARRSVRPEGGFVWLDDTGVPLAGKHLELWINARMTYVFSRSAMRDAPADLGLAEHGVAALSNVFQDEQHGGWFTRVGLDDSVDEGPKDCYGHAHVLLAAAVAAQAGVPGAEALLERAGRTHVARFWDPDAGSCVEHLSRDWSHVDSYRGANSNMHTVEGYLAAAEVTGNGVWRERAATICRRIISRNARAHDWRVPEHYDEGWLPMLDHNAERPADPFRPFGATPGHAFEWSRLLLELSAGSSAPVQWAEDAAELLFHRAFADAVEDGSPGLVYTTDWSGQPVVRERFHWVICEAVMAAETLHQRTNEVTYAELAHRWWSEIDEHFIDESTGAWRHELSPTMTTSGRTWTGRPDAYHAYNALSLPDVPLAPRSTAAR